MSNEHKVTVTVLVNEHKVPIHKERATGREIKQAAIDAKVPIQLDFVLSLELGDRRSKVIGDDDVVPIHEHERFIAVAPDDNS